MVVVRDAEHHYRRRRRHLSSRDGQDVTRWIRLSHPRRRRHLLLHHRLVVGVVVVAAALDTDLR